MTVTLLLDKSPHMCVNDISYMSQPFNIPNTIVISFLNLNFANYIIDKQKFQVNHTVYPPNRNK